MRPEALLENYYGLEEITDLQLSFVVYKRCLMAHLKFYSYIFTIT